MIDFLRKYSLKKTLSPKPTGLMPLSSIQSAVAFIDVEDTSFDACKRELLNFYRDYGIRGEIFFIDFRKLINGERLITSITNTVLRKDLNWYGKPAKEKVALILQDEPDLLISLVPRASYALEYLVATCRARFKVGRQALPGNLFDLVVMDPADSIYSEEDAFRAIVKLMNKIA